MPIILIILSILFSVFVAIYPFKIKNITIDLVTGPLITLCLLFLLKILDFETLRLGIIGNEQIKPWEIIIIFFSTAYVSISTDVTGIFDFLAYQIVRKAKGDGIKLFLFFYLFACILTAFTSNDIVILTLTPIIFYLGNHSSMNILPLLFAEFYGANTLSMLLYIGNPTNIIVGNALKLSFMEYTKVMWIPTIFATILNFLMLFLFFKNQISKKYEIKETSTFSIRHLYGAIFSSILMITMLVFLALSQNINVPIWLITLIFACIFIIEDIAFSIYFMMKHKSLVTNEIEKNKQKLYEIYGIPEEKNEFWLAIKDVPWKILPFIFSIYIFVQGLNQYGVVAWIASLTAHLSNTLAKGIFINGFSGLILSNIINNQPMTIFLSSVLVSPSFNVSKPILMGSAYAVIIASNLGANLSLVGALAGFMWKKILDSKGLKISYWDFLKKGITITLLVFSFTLLMLYLVLNY